MGRHGLVGGPEPRSRYERHHPPSWKLIDGSRLPEGLHLVKATGVIYGAPKQAATTAVTVQVTDATSTTKPHTQNVATATLTITVSPA